MGQFHVNGGEVYGGIEEHFIITKCLKCYLLSSILIEKRNIMENKRNNVTISGDDNNVKITNTNIENLIITGDRNKIVMENKVTFSIINIFKILASLVTFIGKNWNSMLSIIDIINTLCN